MPRSVISRVITCSDAASRGEREDLSGPAVRATLERSGYKVDRIEIVADDLDSISGAIVSAIDFDEVALVVTTGGTGIAPRDVTPEATARVAPRLIPGFGELMRQRSFESTKMAPLSRVQAAVRGRALVINVPGSPRGAVENLEAILHLIPHALELLAGGPVEKHPSA